MSGKPLGFSGLPLDFHGLSSSNAYYLVLRFFQTVYRSVFAVYRSVFTVYHGFIRDKFFQIFENFEFIPSKTAVYKLPLAGGKRLSARYPRQAEGFCEPCSVLIQAS